MVTPAETSTDERLDAAAQQEAAIEAGRKLFAQDVRFMLGVAALRQLPPPDLPEIAFAGRSNVGKSSLINALFNRKDMARTSNTPGRTQELNFFDLGGRLVIVDLPGYGFARAPKAKVDAWTELVFGYLRGRPNLRLVCVLIDARHGFKTNDHEAFKILGRAAVPFQIVLTKADLVSEAAASRLIEQSRKDLRPILGSLPEPLLTTSRKGGGIAELRGFLGQYAAQPSGPPSP